MRVRSLLYQRNGNVIQLNNAMTDIDLTIGLWDSEMP